MDFSKEGTEKLNPFFFGDGSKENGNGKLKKKKSATTTTTQQTYKKTPPLGSIT